MFSDPDRRDRINSFALVSYIPSALAGFLDRLRQELVPTCFLHAHVTILPPRSLRAPVEDVWKHIAALAPLFSPFDVELTEIQVFPVSDVIYIQIGQGADRLVEMHAVFNTDGLEQNEAFEFVPHITLAQQLETDELDELTIVARKRWSEYQGERRFRVDTITFVQNTTGNTWVDIGECRLGTSEARLLQHITVP
jgi:2'-5' RNA ligase